MAPVAQAKQTDQCFGIAYYDSWRRTHGLPPVCIGLSQQKESVEEETGSSQEQLPSSADRFKVVCVGYSAHSVRSKTGDLPYCEGLELVLIEQASAAEASHDAASGPLGGQMHASAAHQPTTTAAQHGEQQPGGLQHEDENESEQVPNYLTAKLLMRASQNIAKMHAAFNNEGPLRLKPLPSNVHDLANRLGERASENSTKVVGAARSVLDVAYNLVKPIFDSSK